ncbi:hypothetical protein [Holospora curviuscula]|nr:hypothetical protein [Holospora curviuscula]
MHKKNLTACLLKQFLEEQSLEHGQRNVLEQLGQINFENILECLEFQKKLNTGSSHNQNNAKDSLTEKISKLQINE